LPPPVIKSLARQGLNDNFCFICRRKPCLRARADLCCVVLWMGFEGFAQEKLSWKIYEVALNVKWKRWF
ncbi:MAG: hypothetical protein KAW12_24265, partial [Candidatus Aminicenantes bacterium]|nr:hypothetical protein [Candidatus Aminicenantes bacterium]